MARPKQLIKKISLGIAFFSIGFVLAVASYSFFRYAIQDLYQWSTGEHIQFSGKDFFLFGSQIFMLSCGLVFLLFYIANRHTNAVTVFGQAVLLLLVFSISIIGISAADAHLKIVECTACDDGILTMSHNAINYRFILTASALISIIPSIIRMLRQLKET